MQRIDPASELRGQLDRARQGEASDVSEDAGERTAAVEGHHEVRLPVGFPELEDRHDVAGVELAREPSFALEACAGRGVVAALRAQQLEHDVGPVGGTSAVDDAARPLAELRSKPVAADVHAAIIPAPDA